MRVVVLTSGHPNNIALCNKIAKKHLLEGIVISRNIPKKKLLYPFRRFLNRIAFCTVGRPLCNAWKNMQKYYADQYCSFPNIPQIWVKNINDLKVINFIRNIKPDLIVVSGTNLVGKKIIQIAQSQLGIINLHTGISPYVKGGPNCTNWCLAENKFYLIGNTVMWLDTGIDSGPIISTEQTPLQGDESLLGIHLKVMEHAHDLYIRVLDVIKNKNIPDGIPQSMFDGMCSTYYSWQWSAWPMLKALYYFKRNYSGSTFNSESFKGCSNEIKLIPLILNRSIN